MDKGVFLLGSLVLGAGGGFAAAMLASPAPVAASPATVSARRPSPEAEALERLERRVDEMEGALRSRPVGPAAAGGGPADAGGREPAPSGDPADATAPAPVVDGPSASPDRLDALEQRVAALEKAGPPGTRVPADLSKVPTGELSAMVQGLLGERRGADAIRVAEELLRREDLTPDRRVEMEMNIGFALRTSGKHAEAEARFRETLARVGEDSESAGWLQFQIAWQRFYQSDAGGGGALMETAANHPRVQPLVRAHALYQAASFAKQSGDNARARALLERLLARHAQDFPESQQNMRSQAEAWLKELSGN